MGDPAARLTARRFADRLLLLDGVLCLRPFSPATLEGLCIETFRNQLFRHTGARAFFQSGAVEDYLLVLWQCGGPGIDGRRVHPYGTGNFLAASFPVIFRPHIDQHQIG